jgi:hypothetical protein
VFVLTPQIQAREAAKIERAVAEKLPALFAHFSIQEDDPDRWQQLALALAHKHVKGFQVVHSTGAQVVESVELLCRLYRYFIRTKADRKQRNRKQRNRSRKVTDAEICKVSSNDEDFKRAFPELKSPSQKRLQNLVVEAKKLRRERIAWFVRLAAYKRSLGPEESVDPMLQGGEPPVWFSDRPVVFGKLDKSGPQRRREK